MGPLSYTLYICNAMPYLLIFALTRGEDASTAVTIFRLPILRRCATYTDVVDEVRVTVIHELAHHMGIDDDRLDDLGWA